MLWYMQGARKQDRGAGRKHVRDNRFVEESGIAAINTHALPCACEALLALTDKEPEVSAGASKACKGLVMVQFALHGLMPPAEQQCSLLRSSSVVHCWAAAKLTRCRRLALMQLIWG
jgi:hypothetical protein